MTRLCMFCDKNLGEKCPWCGGSDLTFFRSHEDGETFKVFICLKRACPGKKGGFLAPNFREGSGPKGERPYNTHTVCLDCQKLPEKQRMAIYHAKHAGMVTQ